MAAMFLSERDKMKKFYQEIPIDGKKNFFLKAKFFTLLFTPQLYLRTSNAIYRNQLLASSVGIVPHIS